ncbi:MAG: HlyD family efflux transporter periplasmic adaptor subunit [Treponema sp.]|jgi:biotin carboxyl carrier protein|nr:HlyD family efflux transporter periplasmic adaptor subunit [Treponema sp.]
MKLNKTTVGAIILVLLILILFLSKTIYTYKLPEVTGSRPRRGSLSKLEISSGIASWAETETIYAAAAGAVGRVFVREGDEVEAGQILFEMAFDIVAAERRLAETDNNIAKLEADIRSQRSKLNSIYMALAVEGYIESGEEPISADSLSGQAGIIAMEISRAKQLLEISKVEFEMGFQSRNELTNAENSLKSLLYRYEVEAEDLEHSLAMKTIDLENLRLSRETIREVLRDYRNNAVIRAPAAGTILSLSAERGKFYPENAPLVSIGVGHEFIVECAISLDNNFINPGDTCELSNSSHVLKGTVQRVRPSAQGKTVSVTIVSDEVSDGESFSITFEKNSASSFTLVPNSSVNQDSDGYFVYQIRRRNGIMGNEYYLERLNIFIGDSDHQNTTVIRGIMLFEPIVLVSNKALSNGLTVTLKNAEDFFEN